MSDILWINFSYFFYFLAEINPLKGICDIESHLSDFDYFLIIKIDHTKAFSDKGQ